jgi:hypothetical protein
MLIILSSLTIMMSDSIKENVNGFFEERTRFIITSRYKILLSVTKLLTILIILIGLLGAVGFYRLPPGWVTPSFQVALQETIGAVNLKIPEAQVRWGGWRHPLGINIHNVSIKKEDKGLTLEVPSILISLKIIPLLTGKAEIGRCSFESAKLYSKSMLLGVISGKAKKRNQNITLQADFENVDASALIHFFMGQGDPPKASFPIAGKILLEGGTAIGVTLIKLSGKSEGGVLVIPGIYPQPVAIDKVQFVISGTERTLSLKKTSVKRGKATLEVGGTLHAPVSWKTLYEKGGNVDVTLEGKGGAILVDDLELLWPQGLSPKPRHWVVNQLSKGTADHLTIHMQGLLGLDPIAQMSRFEISEMNGEIDASGITVNYFGKLPPVIDTTGKCRFTREKFMIDAVGKANGITLNSANVVIHDLHLVDQTIHIVMDLEGPVRNSLEIVNADPLRLAQKLDLDPSRISGESTTHLELSFPLETDLPLELVNVTARSQIQGGEILYNAQVNGKPVKLNQGTFSLDVSKKSLEMKGEASLLGVLSHIEWQENFDHPDIPFRRQFLLKGSLDLEKLKNFGMDTTDYLKGVAKADIKYTVNQVNEGLVEGLFDLTSATMVSPILSWQKEENESAQLKLKIRKVPSTETFMLDSATLTAPNLTTSIQGKKDGYFDVGHLQIGNSHLTSKVKWTQDGHVEALIKGKVLDLSYILDDSAPEPLIKPKASKDKGENVKIKVKLLLDEVRLGKDNAIHQVSGEMLYHGDILMGATLNGKARHNNEAISLSMNPLSRDQQQFILESGDGGHLLEILGAGYDIEGGKLFIKGVKTTTDAGKSWGIEGNISIDNFTIKKAPLLARLLSAASLQGIVNFFSGRGIHFYEGQADFSLTPDHLLLKSVRLMSPSLGLILEGSIDRLHHKVNLSGELIPLYMVNALLANIPLLGGWFSGGREDGIFMTQFTLKGDRDDPDLLVNPISTVTPGLVREFLANQEKKKSQEVKH